MWLQDVMDIPLGCHGATDQYQGDRVLLEMASHTITPAMGVVCLCKAKAGLRSSPLGLYTRTRLPSLLILNLGSSLKTTWFHFATVQFPRARHHSKRRRRSKRLFPIVIFPLLGEYLSEG
ncbi:uncharacterized protein TNCV_804491 [Trichonephila clavipes]|nr:uncharacterized protein TNCV_804491 [Trichonephila clavipes]